MEFYIYDPKTDRLEVTVFDQDLFSPNGEHHFYFTKTHTISTTLHTHFVPQIFLVQPASKLAIFFKMDQAPGPNNNSLNTSTPEKLNSN